MNRFRTINLANSEFGQNEPCGVVINMRAGATLTVGQAVVLDANGEVVTSGTAADGVKFAGIVVGGKQTGYYQLLDAAHIGTQAALADETVLVMIQGICYGVADDTITQGARVTLGATAGQVNDATAAYTVATAMSAGVADEAILLFLNGVQVEV